MRPRLARRGELIFPVFFSKRRQSFNAAPARSPGRTDMLSCSRSSDWRLQCGPGSLAGENIERHCFLESLSRRFNAAPARSPGRTFRWRIGAESAKFASMRPRLARRGELEGSDAKARPTAASMRPRLARRGERRWTRYAWCSRLELQCGPGSLAGENVGVCGQAGHSPRFNAAPARSPGRTYQWSISEYGGKMASMRPRLARRGEPRLEVGGKFLCFHASMRPRLARRGERPTRLLAQPIP